MLICKKCGKDFPSSKKINGVRKILNKRKYCLDCSPFGSRNTKKLEIKTINSGDKAQCSRCLKDYTYLRSKGHSKAVCNGCWTKKKRHELKIKALDYKGGKCQICGYSKCTQALEFHHLDKDEKDFNISSNNYKKWDVIKKELDKCILLCCLCHREYHAGLLNINA